MHGICHCDAQAFGVPGGAGDKRDALYWFLREWLIDDAFVLIHLERIAARVRDDAYDLGPRIAGTEADALANGVLMRPVGASKHVIDDGDVLRVGVSLD